LGFAGEIADAGTNCGAAKPTGSGADTGSDERSYGAADRFASSHTSRSAGDSRSRT
jgi:hypothetical protein